LENYAVGILLALVVAFRIALWIKFRHHERGRYLGISTLQTVLVFAAAGVSYKVPQAATVVLLCALVGIIALSFVPVGKTKI
jgi:hypothetical protein